MEIICTQCGARLPQENARYCNNCGSLVASRSSGPVPSSLAQRTVPSSPHEQQSGSTSRPPLREQIAQQPPARPLRPSSPDHTPAWMSELERSGSGRGRTPVDPLRMKRSMEVAGEQRPADMREATVLNRPEQSGSPRKEGVVEGRQPAREPDVADKPTQAHVPAVEPIRRLAPPNAGPSARELRVKVWPQEDQDRTPAESLQSEREQKSAPSMRSEAGTGNAGTALDDLPTRPLVANAATPIPPLSPEQRSVNPPPAVRRREGVTDDVERLNTTPLLTPKPRRNGPVSSPANVFVAQAGQVEQIGQVGQRHWQVADGRDALDRPSLHPVPPVTPPSRPVVQPQQPQSSQPAQNRGFVQQPISPVPPVSPLPLPPAAPVQERGQMLSAPGSGATKTGSARRAKRTSRTMVMMLLAALAILIVGGLGAWIIVFHPFTVPAITQPQQTFSNTQLGFSVRYPGGWAAQANASNGTVLFFDSSHTGQVKLLVTPANGDPGQILSKEAAQLGMTGVKQGNALSFAGSSWQQVQGSLQVAGANYTAVLLATVHGNHMYTLIQMAPQMTYTDEEQIIFSPMRASFRFLP